MSQTGERHNLQRFVDAQEPVYARVCAELRAGKKLTHWMWFIFPQVLGLGLSSISRKFAIASLEEARAYLNHTILGARLRECCMLVNLVEGRCARDIFGEPDDMKLRSSMTLFALATEDNLVFHGVLKKYFQGKMDRRTLELLGMTEPGGGTSE